MWRACEVGLRPACATVRPCSGAVARGIGFSGQQALNTQIVRFDCTLSTAASSSSPAPCGTRRCSTNLGRSGSVRGYATDRLRPDTNQRLAWRRRIAQLHRNSDADPQNAHKLAELLRACNHCDPQQGIKFFERTDPSVAFSSEAAVREYIRALVLANRWDHVDMDVLLRQNWAKAVQTFAPPQVAGAGVPTTAIELKLPNSEPLSVKLADSNKRAVFRLIRSALTMLIMVAAISVFAEGLAGNVQKGFGMGSKKIVPVEDVTTSFDDVKGCDEVKEELREIIDYLKDPEKFTRLGAKLPKGMLMSGVPGTGKTLLARAIAGEAAVPFMQVSGSEFEEMFVGVGARRIRDLFDEARKRAPCIVFIDEIDAVGSKRSSRDNTSVRMTLNQLLVELDGFEQNNGIVVICATNFAESLDKALTRPGRLDKNIVVPVPDLKGRLEILNMYAEKLVIDQAVDMQTIARRTAGMTGADLFNILNIAAVRSSAEGLAAIPMQNLEQAFDRVVVGLERTNPMSDQERRLTAYHEGGHTLMSFSNAAADPVHKATIMPRGNALGITWSLPDREKYSERLCELEARLDVLMGGKAAEELIFGPKNVTAGCTSDLRAATGLARRMVMNFGMVADGIQPGTLYMEVEDYAALSDEAKENIDKKTQTLLTNAYVRAADYLKEHEQELHNLANALVEHETLGAEEIQLAIEGRQKEIADRRAEEKARVKEPPRPKDVKEPAQPPTVERHRGSARVAASSRKRVEESESKPDPPEEKSDE